MQALALARHDLFRFHINCERETDTKCALMWKWDYSLLRFNRRSKAATSFALQVSFKIQILLLLTLFFYTVYAVLFVT